MFYKNKQFVPFLIFFVALLSVFSITSCKSDQKRVSEKVEVSENIEVLEKVAVKVDSIITRVASCACGQLQATVVGPDPERISLCSCFLCQRLSGSAFSIQARFPKEQVTIEGKSNVWRFPIEGAEPVDYTHCAELGATFYFCPVCGSTVYYTSDVDDSRIGIKIGTFNEPTFPAPKITGHIEYRHPWTMDLEGLSLEVVQGKKH